MANTNYIDFKCLVQALERTDENIVAADAVETVIARFDLCETWDGLTVYARFKHANIATPFDVKLDTDSCAVVPWEVLQPFGFHVSLFGDSASGERLTAAAVFVDVESTVSLAEHEPIPSTPTLLQQLEQSIAQATEVAQSVRNDADAGVFDGNVVEFGSITATVGENVGTPSVEVFVSGTSTVKDVEFAFDGLKGEELPEGGAEGEALLKTAEGKEWGVVSVQGGGTGATNAQEARDNLDAAATQHAHDASDINAGTLAAERLPVIAVEGGGTGAETAAAALTNLGAAAAEHEHSAADITSGTLPIGRGGTGVTTEKEIALKAYPIGAIYLSFSNTSPASLFGGTWQKLTDVFLRAANDTNTGGSDTHTLTVEQMPSHNHQTLTGSGSVGTWRLSDTQSGGKYQETDYIQETGGNQSHNNMPKYQNVYAWKRTA